MKFWKLAAALGAVGTLAAAAPASAQTQAPGMADGMVIESESPTASRFGGSVSTMLNIGSGTFVSDKFSDDPSVLQTLSLAPTMRIDEIPGGGMLMLRQDFALEYTDPNNTTGRRWDYGDTLLALSAGSLWKEEHTGINLGATVSASLPISYVSRFTNKITSVNGGVNLSRGFGKFSLMLGLMATKNFYTDKTLGISKDMLEDPSGISCEGECRGGGYLMNWRLASTLGGAYRFDDKWSANFSLSWAGGYRFESPDDEYTSQYAVPGAASMDIIGATLGANYQIDSRYSVSGGFATNQPLRHDDNKSLRFIFWDTTSPANNYSGLYLAAAATF